MSTPYGSGDDGRPQNVPPPGYQQPGYQQQGYPQAGYGQPGYQQPGYQQPGYPQGPGPAAGSAPPEPSEVTTSFWLWIADVVVGLIGSVIAFVHLSSIIDQILAASSGTSRNPELVVSIVKGSVIAGAVIGIVVVLLHVLFAVFMRRGRNWARIVLTVLGALSVLSTLIGVFGTSTVAVNGQQIETRTGISTAVSVIQALIIIAAVVMSFRPAANAYFAAHKR